MDSKNLEVQLKVFTDFTDFLIKYVAIRFGDGFNS